MRNKTDIKPTNFFRDFRLILVTEVVTKHFTINVAFRQIFIAIARKTLKLLTCKFENRQNICNNNIDGKA
jgi:hypothetical protein